MREHQLRGRFVFAKQGGLVAGSRQAEFEAPPIPANSQATLNDRLLVPEDGLRSETSTSKESWD